MAVYGGEMGTAHPIKLVESADNGRWVVACEARSITAEDAAEAMPRDDRVRDALVPFLFRGGGEGQAIGELVAVSSDDRWLAIYRDEELILLDDVRGLETTLDPGPVHPTRGPYRRVAAFDSDSTHLVYFRVANGTTTVTIRELGTQRERDVTIPGQRVSRIVPEPAGHWVRVLFAREGDEDEVRRYEPPPVPGRSRKSGPVCDRPRPPFMFALHDGQAWLDLDSGELRRDVDVLAHLEDVVITKGPDKALRAGATELVPAACDADVMAVSLHPLRIVASCAGPTPDAPIELFGPAFHARVTGPIPRRMNAFVRFVDGPYVCPTHQTCLSIDDGSVVPLQGGNYIAVGVNVIGLDRDGLFFATGAQGIQRLPGVNGRAGASAGDVRAIETTIVDLSRVKVLGEVERNPMAVDIAGRALIPARVVNDRFRWPIGPLRWVTPRHQ